MDFDESVVSDRRSSPDGTCLGSAEPTAETGHGSPNSKRKRSGLLEDDAWGMLEVGGADFSSRKGSENFAAFVGSNLWASAVDYRQKILSFTSSESPSTVGNAGVGSGRNIGFSIAQNELLHGRMGRALPVSSGVGIREGLQMQGHFSGLKGPFTPSQWMELEHQALIYKYIVATVPVPSNLLLPLKNSMHSYMTPGPFALNVSGWGPFQVGYPSSNDPEPGRCRRTDGKKWRCSKEAVPDQKYCENHINRGRHRSRKPVEGRRTSQASPGSTTKKVAPVAPTSTAPVLSRSSTPNNLVQPSVVGTSIDLHARSQGFPGLHPTPTGTDLKSKEPNATFKESSISGFELVLSEPIDLDPVLHLLEDWQKDQSSHVSASWHEELNSDWTQLSMSIPVARDLSPSSNSSAQDKSAVSTPRLSPNMYPVHMSLGMSLDEGEPFQKHSLRFPVTWGKSIGGPLGEALTRQPTDDEEN